MYDHMIVAVLNNEDKRPSFTLAQRLEMVQRCVKPYGNIEVMTFDGLLVDLVRRCKAQVIIRGLRAISDFEYEFQMAATNHRLAPELETVFLMTSTEYSFLSSSIVRQLGALSGDITGMVPEEIRHDVIKGLTRQ